jgi:hypothetical protein
MRALLSLAAVSAVAGCGTPAIDLELQLPPDDVDLSCVQAVRVYAWGVDVLDTPPNTCLTLDAPVATFAELRAAVRGKLELDLPVSGLAGIDVTGMTSTDCIGGDSVFYGGATFTGGDMTVPLRANFDCAARQNLVVRPVDYVALATGTCTSPATSFDPGSIHPTMLDQPMPAMVYDLTTPPATVSGGVATLNTMVAIDEDSCNAMGDPITGSISCIHPGSPGACTTGSEVELTTVDTDFAIQSMDQIASERYAQIVYGSVRDATSNPKHPIVGARVEIVEDDAELGEIQYATMSAPGAPLTRLVGAAATDAGGLFIAYMDHPIRVRITAPGYLTREVSLAAADYIFGASTIVLRPQ